MPQKKLLGIHDGHNSSVALLIDGELTCAAQEERFTYVKNQGGFPVKSIQYLHEKYDLSDCEQVIFAGHYMAQHDWSREKVLNNYKNSDSIKNLIKQKLKQVSWLYGRYTQQHQKNRFDLLPNYLKNKKTVALDHHLLHAATTYFGQGNFENDILVITCDGFGDNRSGSAYIGHKGKLKPIAHIAEKDSLGRVYSYFTYLFNMVPYEHEYKIMGMAPYCTDHKRVEECVRKLEKLFQFSHENTAWKYVGKYPSVQSAGKEFKKIFYETRFDVMSAALQKFTEDMLTRWVSGLIKKTNVNRLALSGGVFMNVKANQLLASLKEVQSCFVFPSCGDETNAIGAVYHQWFESTQSYPQKLKHFYLGPVLDTHSLTSLLKKISDQVISYQEESDIEQKIAELLAKGEIVGRVKSRMEFGARSLGNRSILANPSIPGTIKVINDMIKGRDFWMPFAPSLLAEDFGKYFEKTGSVVNYEYMVFTASSLPGVRTYALGGLHPYDFTGRPQSVSAEQNADYYTLLKKYKALTGESLILNTSYNLHGYPMVNGAEQALDVFLKSGLKYLALDQYLLSKK